MTKLFKTAALSATAALALGANAAHAADATATATAQILEQITVTRTSHLNFGTIVPDTAASGNVTVAATSAGTRTCDANLTCAGAASVSSAAFDVTASAGSTVSVTGLTGLTQLTSGTDTMAVSLAGSTLDLSLGSDTLYVGGDLTVGANQPTGTYTGNFTVSVNY
ncbi:MAG: DUF4402 domain-containing protein [Sphingomonadaceae bacterium]|nr:DUF4402 domain-containing protein [Sphingomonadaceae bacterium]